MLFSKAFRVVVAFTLVFSCLTCSPGVTQSLEDVMQQATPQETGQSTAMQPAANPHETEMQSIDLVNSFVISPWGLPSVNRLLQYLINLIKQLFPEIAEKNPNTPLPPATPGDEEKEPTPPPTPKPSGDLGASARSPSAESGSDFLKRTEKLSRAQREEEIVKAIMAGNIPSFLQSFKEVEITRTLKDGKKHTAKIRVLPDYLAIGSNNDFVRIPMSPIAAQKIAEHFGCQLPTTRMVDDIYEKAQTKLNPQPMSGGQYSNWQARMTKNEFYQEHQRLVESQRAKSGHKLGELVAGHKKDVVISNFLDSHRKNVIIYGWHDKRNKGKPIQGYGWTHENTYADYSHGIRLVQKTMIVDGKEMAVADVLKDPVLCWLVSKEGVVNDTRAVR